MGRPTADLMEINKEHNESDRKILEAINVERHFAGCFFIYLFVCLFYVLCGILFEIQLHSDVNRLWQWYNGVER